MARQRGAGLVEELAFHSYAPFAVAAEVGTPPQSMRLLLDTGSGITWLFGSNCTGCDAGSPHYSAGQSSSAALRVPHFSLQLLHGSGFEGRVVADSVSVGPLKVEKQPLAVVERVVAKTSPRKAEDDQDAQGQLSATMLRGQMESNSESACYSSKLMTHLVMPCELRKSKLLLAAGFSGVLGMGRSSIAGRDPGEPPALFDSLVGQGALSDDVFSLDMAAMQGGEGKLHLGGAPEGGYAGRLRYYNCSDGAHWQLAFDSVNVRARPPPGSTERVSHGSYMSHFCIDARGCAATLASGSAFIVGPTEQMLQLTLSLQVDTRCRGLEQLPSIFFRVLGHDFEVSPAEYVMRVPHEGRTKCVLALLPHRDEQNRRDWILGAPFFRRHYVVFDRRYHRIGIAEKASVRSDRGGAAPAQSLREDGLIRSFSARYDIGDQLRGLGLRRLPEQEGGEGYLGPSEPIGGGEL